VTLSRRLLVPVSELPSWLAQGYREVFRMPRSLRTDEDAAVIEWLNPAAPRALLSDRNNSSCGFRASCIVIGADPDHEGDPR